MKADDVTLRDIFESAYQYLIPVFQRYYSWEKPNWEQLWEDILDLYESESFQETHFLGSLVFVPEGSPARVPVHQVIDGQQRIITLSLFLCALRDVARRYDHSVAEEIHETYIVRPHKDDDKYYRVFPRLQDREDYQAIVEGRHDEATGQISSGYNYFLNKIDEEVAEDEDSIRDLFALLRGQIDFVQINLDGGENPYQIFSSLNSTGVDLNEGDLIRNFVFMHVDLDGQEQFDKRYWSNLEDLFHYEDGELQDGAFADFFRHFLLKEGDYIRKDSTFQAFEERYSDSLSSDGELAPEALTTTLIRYAGYYNILRGNQPHASEEITDALQKLNNLRSSTTYPLILKVIALYEDNAIEENEVVEVIERVAAFIVRRFICDESSRAYVRWFPSACREIEDNPVSDVTRFLENKGFPSDDRFAEKFLTYDLAPSNYSKSILEALERSYDHKEPATLSRTQVEHIMPQTLSEAWKETLGEEVDRIYAKWLHTPGNLTLSAYNPEMHNNPFEVKKQEYNRSNVVLNRKLAQYEQWGEEQIRERGKKLATRATDVWPGPPFE
jgi:uncharacterized protein with ParB-like and HNH nuclease domain